ncbi:aconitate hydratase [Nocardioides panacisoli]|uniref:aconitate hydratase n=1 Tax=Nocardioides panacisoli TaxID=627624 RepID=UPI001C625AC4|nr:aconitate hydratase [Nocardioides panacisoli]QYJ05450.1 aconitate hydratase [Nocardioides panacisoli]
MSSARNVTQKLIADHLVAGALEPGTEIGLHMDQTLTQDATGTLVMLELEAMGLDRARTDVSVQYVDHNLLQSGSRNAEDHEFLRSACQRFGIWYSKPGNGVSHPTHMQRFGVPGATLAGSDSHTPAAGSLGMLAIGLGGIEVAQAIAGDPVHLQMPQVWGVHLTGELPPWVSAKDVILEMLRRHDVKGGTNRVIEYHGPGVATLTAMDRHVIANMGAELGATSSVFPSDERVREFLAAEHREDDYRELVADEGATYDVTEEIDLGSLEPLIALPSSPGKVVPVTEVAGTEIEQAVIGSSANPGLRDFAIAAAMVKGRQTDDRVSFDINPTSREILQDLTRMGATFDLIGAGARLHQSGCLGCIGMGQTPTSHGNSLRTMPRNFPGRSGTPDDHVFLCSPETAAASALTGEITDPRRLAEELGLTWGVELPSEASVNTEMLLAPPPPEEAAEVALVKGDNIAELPDFEAYPDTVETTVLIDVGDNISTDTIMPAGADALPFRSNIPKLAEFAFRDVDPDYARKALEVAEDGGHAIVGGATYGQGSSREHAALAPRYLGLRLVVAESFARIHWQNLVNFGVLPVEFVDPADHAAVEVGDRLRLDGVRAALEQDELELHNTTQGTTYAVRHRLSPRQLEVLLDGGLVPQLRNRTTDEE